jgi:Cu2+-exporting ATPase
MISLSDTLRPASADAIKELRALGMHTVMLTGDNSLAAKRVADEIGIEELHAELLPAQKESVIRELSERGGVIMIGDGINDAPALARADVGMAIGGGTDIAMESADVVLVGKNLTDAARAVRLGRAVYKNICENLFWAFAYNVIGIPLAAGVLAPLGITMSPMLAAAAMSLSSICVVSNALRLSGFGRRYGIKLKENKEKQVKNMNITVKIEGMMCPHCEARVKSAILAVPGALSAEVSHSEGAAHVEISDDSAKAAVKTAVEAAGYPVTDII